MSGPQDIELADGDYVLKDGAAWLTVKNVSIRIRLNEKTNRVYITAWPLGLEFTGPELAGDFIPLFLADEALEAVEA